MNTIIFFLLLISMWENSPFQHLMYINNYTVYEEKCTLSIEDYIVDIGFRESSNRYHIVNGYGYMGRYQFSPATVRNMGYNITKSEFIKNEWMQDQIFIQLLLHNRQILKDVIQTYEGTDINGRKITESGILAAAHLVGPYHVKRYLKYGVVRKDAYGTSVVDYLIEFSGYNLNIG